MMEGISVLDWTGWGGDAAHWVQGTAESRVTRYSVLGTVYSVLRTAVHRVRE